MTAFIAIFLQPNIFLFCLFIRFWCIILPYSKILNIHLRYIFIYKNALADYFIYVIRYLFSKYHHQKKIQIDKIKCNFQCLWIKEIIFYNLRYIDSHKVKTHTWNYSFSVLQKVHPSNVQYWIVGNLQSSTKNLILFQANESVIWVKQTMFFTLYITTLFCSSTLIIRRRED